MSGFETCCTHQVSTTKKLIRSAFRDAVFARDRHRCVMCSAHGVELDAHHITDRTLMPNGGYVASNGISLCAPCHEKAEAFHSTGVAELGWSPDDLYARVGSSLQRAMIDSQRLAK